MHLTSIYILKIYPLCVCGSIEDTGHFLLRCPLYHNHRQDMLISVSLLCQPTVNGLLYGVDNLSFNDNKQIFDAVYDFLIKKKDLYITANYLC